MIVCMQRIRQEVNIPEQIPMTYAGRLDPMAEGLVIFLVGEMRFSKDSFLKLDKKYRASFFYGAQTDTYDVLGKIQGINFPDTYFDQQKMMEHIQQFQSLGTFEQVFPPFSSRKIEGKSLFQYARENIHIAPQKHMVTLYDIKLNTITIKQSSDFLEEIIFDTQQVVGDFRQEEIQESWLSQKNSFPEKITIYTMTFHVSSGFYVRQWIHDFGKYIRTGAVTVSIRRTKIGNFDESMLQGKSFRIFLPNELP